MAYTTPPTFVADTDLTAADLNILGDDIVYLKGVGDGVSFSGAQVTRSAATSIANTTDSAVTWTAEAFDVGGWYSSGTKVIVPAGAVPSGYTTIGVIVIIRTTFASNGTGGRRINVYVNGSTIGGQWIAANGSDVTQVNYTDFAIVSALDEITMQVYQTSGGALNISDTQMSVVRIGPAS